MRDRPLLGPFVDWSSRKYRRFKGSHSWDLVAHPVTQVIGKQALVDILDLSEVAWTCWGASTPRSGLGLRMVCLLYTSPSPRD